MGNQLSGGQQQIHRAAADDERFVLKDEPSEGLAPVIIDQVGTSSSS